MDYIIYVITDLSGREAMFVKVGGVVGVGKIPTELDINQAALNLIPIFSIDNVLLQPMRVIPEASSLVTLTVENGSDSLVGDDDGEKQEADHPEDEKEHDGEIYPEEEGDAEAGAD